MFRRRLHRIRTGNGRATNWSFVARMMGAYALALLAVSAVGYQILNQRLQDSWIASYSQTQRADADTFDTYAIKGGSGSWLPKVQQLLEAVQQRPGTVETKLIDRHGMIVSSGVPVLIGRSDVDARIRAALDRGRWFAGHEQDAAHDTRDFEFVAPVTLDGQPYAYEVSYNHDVLDAQLGDVRSGLALVALLALLGGSLIFYLVGGRALIRSHRGALDRATIDDMTGLANRRAFDDELPRSLSLAQRDRSQLALAVIDLDDFKLLNDRLGHSHGDEMLRRLAAALHDGRIGDRGFRIGGDEFTALLPCADADGARVATAELQRRIAANGVRSSMGVALVDEASTPHDLLAQADAALYDAKRRGGGRISHFDDIRHESAVATAEKKAAVLRLAADEPFVTVFQPIWDIDDGGLIGVEALMRPDPGLRLSGPAEAFDIAQQIGKVHELDRRCVVQALARVNELPRSGLLFLNICPETLDLDANGDDWLVQAAREAGRAPERIVLEVTERSGGRIRSVIRCLTRLRGHGFKVAIDDVGTGNSGLQLLRAINPDFVKLDRTVVASAATDPTAHAVLTAIATFAAQTGSYVIAEGVESIDQLEFLQTIDTRPVHVSRMIRGGQGYALGRPGEPIEADGTWQARPRAA